MDKNTKDMYVETFEKMLKNASPNSFTEFSIKIEEPFITNNPKNEKTNKKEKEEVLEVKYYIPRETNKIVAVDYRGKEDIEKVLKFIEKYDISHNIE